MKQFLALSIVLAATVGVDHTACSQSLPNTSLVAYYEDPTTAMPLLVAKENGIFKKHDLDVTLKQMTDVSRFRLAADDWDCVFGAFLGELPPSNAQATVKNISLCLAEGMKKNGEPVHMLIARKTSHINSIADLRG